MENLVVHCKKAPYDVYVGRPSKWGNPYTHIADRSTLAEFVVADREEAVALYETWLRSQPDLVAKVRSELKGKVLGCWCAPKSCHANVLTQVANEENDE